MFSHNVVRNLECQVRNFWVSLLGLAPRDLSRLSGKILRRRLVFYFGHTLSFPLQVILFVICEVLDLSY